ncbi:hypothetical protein [Pseudoduganella armeniaca]|uniref:hypothetical protein n=1 Tax=Pseudoduganella armeniaca TaxID=2072590 RepID=UPI0011B24564|nr:hypothetical protein [Pseudoduganella armeniaca]
MATDDQFRACRRSNFVRAAYVEAAIRVNDMFGSDRAYWILIREKVPAPVIERILQGIKGQVRCKDRRYATRVAGTRERDRDCPPGNVRSDELTSQRIEVALVFQAMLGTDAAANYLRDAGIPVWITARVLGSTKRRPSPDLVEA